MSPRLLPVCNKNGMTLSIEFSPTEVKRHPAPAEMLFLLAKLHSLPV